MLQGWGLEGWGLGLTEFGMLEVDQESDSSGVRGPPQFLKKRSENAWANENLSCGFPSILGIAPGVAPRIVVFALFKS